MRSGNTDRFRFWEAPRGRGLDGIDATPAGHIFYASLAGNHIAAINTATGVATPLIHQPPVKGRDASGVTHKV